MKKEIIIGVTGSVAAYKACDIISRLKCAGCNVTAVMTAEAMKFITPFLLAHVTGNKVYSDMFEAPSAWGPDHISLSQKAGVVLIAPATANIIAKFASGICDDLLTCVVTAAKAPVLIAPAMNENMYLHKATQDNIKRLKAFGYKFIGPEKGKLVCGSAGIGHIAGIEDIVKEALKLAR